MRRTLTGALLTLLLALPATAADVAVEGKFAFDWHANPKKVKCQQVKGALLRTLKQRFTCAADDGTAGSASGVKIEARCKAKKGRGEYLLFGKLADCKKEHETQLANAEGA